MSLRNRVDPFGELIAVSARGTLLGNRGGPFPSRWTPAGYDAKHSRPRGISVDVLTPPAILTALSAGFRPRWHESARR